MWRWIEVLLRRDPSGERTAKGKAVERLRVNSESTVAHANAVIADRDRLKRALDGAADSFRRRPGH